MFEENSHKIRVLNIVPDTFVDGPGMRTSVYCAGCAHFCEGCHNPESHDFHAGTPMTPREIWDAIRLESPDSNITFSGGDPLYQVDGFTELAKIIKEESGKSIWCYTGFRYEEIIVDSHLRQILPFIDVLVDGPFILEQRDLTILFRGSRNQRLIDVAASLAHPDGIVVPWHQWWG